MTNTLMRKEDTALVVIDLQTDLLAATAKIGRASCRERV